MGIFEYCEDDVIIFNGNEVNINTFDELYELIRRHVESELLKPDTWHIIDRWADRNQIELPHDLQRAITLITYSTWRWALDDLWYHRRFEDEILGILILSYDPNDPELAPPEEPKKSKSQKGAGKKAPSKCIKSKKTSAGKKASKTKTSSKGKARR